MSAFYGAARLRGSLAWFLAGRAVSAMLGLAIFALVVRVLPVQEYGLYVAIVAAIEIAFAVSTFGLDWVAARFVPEYREQAPATFLRRFCANLVALRLGTLLLLAVVAAAAPSLATATVGTVVPQATLQLALGLLVAEGTFRFVLGSIFEPLLWQGASQLALLVRNACFAFSLVMLAQTAPASVQQVIELEMLAATSGLIAALIMLVALLARDRSPGLANFQPPALHRMVGIGLHNYVGTLAAMPTAQPTLLLICNRFLTPAEVAALGFARNLAELVRRYLPSEMLLGLIRPMLVSNFVRLRSFERLNELSLLVWKCSALALVPVLCALVVAGKESLSLISADKYGSTQWLVVALCAVIFLRINSVQLGTVVNILERPQFLTRALMTSTLALIPFGLLLWLGAGAISFVVTVAMAELLISATLMHYLRRAGSHYRFDIASLRWLALPLAMSVLLHAALPTSSPSLNLAMGLVAALVGSAVAVRTLSVNDWRQLRKLMPRAGQPAQATLP